MNPIDATLNQINIFNNALSAILEISKKTKVQSKSKPKAKTPVATTKGVKKKPIVKTKVNTKVIKTKKRK